MSPLVMTFPPHFDYVFTSNIIDGNSMHTLDTISASKEYIFKIFYTVTEFLIVSNASKISLNFFSPTFLFLHLSG